MGGAIQETEDRKITNNNKTLKAENQQVSEMWTRPVLCRLCECPALDGGVRVDQLDAAKLSKWWLRKIGTDFIPEESEIDELICNFCIWDAR
jgi:hypothetical protein